MAVVRSPDFLRALIRETALATLIHQRRLTPSCGGQAPTAERTVGPARMIAESLTPKPGIREQNLPGADLNCSAALPQERAGGRAFRCAPCGLLVGERSAPIERLRKLAHAFGWRVPAFRRMRVVVQVAAHAHEPRAFREGEVPAHRRTGHVGGEFRQLRAVDEIEE